VDVKLIIHRVVQVLLQADCSKISIRYSSGEVVSIVAQKAFRLLQVAGHNVARTMKKDGGQ
jgi:hypothetical protein